MPAQPSKGSLNGSPPNVSYEPFADFNGADSFTFGVTDVAGNKSAPATVSITIIAVNDPPRFNGSGQGGEIPNQTVAEDAPSQTIPITGITAGPATPTDSR